MSVGEEMRQDRSICHSLFGAVNCQAATFAPSDSVELEKTWEQGGSWLDLDFRKCQLITGARRETFATSWKKTFSFLSPSLPTSSPPPLLPSLPSFLLPFFHKYLLSINYIPGTALGTVEKEQSSILAHMLS